MTDTASETAQRLIDQSSQEDRTVRAPWTAELEAELSARCEDSSEERVGAEPWEVPLLLLDYWGTAEGSGWRVILEREVPDAR